MNIISWNNNKKAKSSPLYQEELAVLVINIAK